MTRRQLLAALAAASPAAAQMASRGVSARPRPKPSGLPYAARLTNVAAKAGLTRPMLYGYPERCDYIVEAMGCGAAFFDFDNDGWLDILLLTGSRWEGAPEGATNRLYRNNRDGSFTDVTARSGLGLSGWFSGVTIGDFDNDGHEDVFLSGWPHSYLFRNNGDGTFTDVTKAAGLWTETPRWSTGCTWVDIDRDGRLDLFVSHYLHFDPAKVAKAGTDAKCNFKGVPINCGPTGLPHETHSLFHNNGDGTFTDISDASGVSRPRGTYGLTAAAADFNDDGWPEIYVACDSTRSLLFSRRPDGTFADTALEAGVAMNEDGLEQAGMGLGIGDFNGDGRLDILKTHFADDTVALFANSGPGGFRDITIPAGLGVETRWVNWGAGIADLSNNARPDLFWVTGSVYPEAERKLPQYPHKTPPVLFRNLGNGRFEQLFEEAGPALAERHMSRGCAFGDFDNDGDLDILIVNLNEPPSLLRNDVRGGGHWLKLKLTGVKSNRSAIGARVIVSTPGARQAQEVMAQSSYLSVNDRRLHFGLGAAAEADVEIRWPSGLRQSFEKVPADRLLLVDEVRGITAAQKFQA